MADQAAFLLADLNCVPKGRADNKEYTAIKEALEKVAGYKDRDDYTANQVLRAVQKLKSTAAVYQSTHDHWYKRISAVGAHRQQKAGEIQIFAIGKLQTGSVLDMAYMDLAVTKAYEPGEKEKNVSISHVTLRSGLKHYTEAKRRYEGEIQRRKLIGLEELEQKRARGKETINRRKRRGDLRPEAPEAENVNANENGNGINI